MNLLTSRCSSIIILNCIINCYSNSFFSLDFWTNDHYNFCVNYFRDDYYEKYFFVDGKKLEN